MALRVANCSGFYGDRLSAARELVEGGPIDVLTGDYLAEITLAILARDKARDATRGYARTFVHQVEDVLAACLDRGIQIVSNAGGLNPHGCRAAIEVAARRLGRTPRIAVVEGEDLLARLSELADAGELLANGVTGAPFATLGEPVVAAAAYLGAWPIVAALEAGADIVVTGRVTDSALTLAPAMWRFRWRSDDWDRLAGGIVAGHLIECGTQVTGGNHSFWREIPELAAMGFPIAEIEADGSFVVTKHPGTGGMVSRDTVLAQLLYEIGSPAYLTPDVTAHFDSVLVEEVGRDRVRVSGARGSPPPPSLKVSAHYAAGFRNHVDVVIGGADAAEKSRAFEALLWSAVGGRERFAEARAERFADPATTTSYTRFAVRDRDEARVGRAFSNAAVELALASVPGITFAGPPTPAVACAGTWPTRVARERVIARVSIGERVLEVPAPALPPVHRAVDERAPAPRPSAARVVAPASRPRPGTLLGEVCGARSGDKGGDANIGVWARDPARYPWLCEYLTAERVRDALPEPFGGAIERHELGNVAALNFVLRGYLGEGGAASARLDNQAKLLGEILRSRPVASSRD
ncbi:MAG: acyclic terpene utilization AtuA family protein [bacterium]